MQNDIVEAFKAEIWKRAIRAENEPKCTIEESMEKIATHIGAADMPRTTRDYLIALVAHGFMAAPIAVPTGDAELIAALRLG
jgi:hypothetical protein